MQRPRVLLLIAGGTALSPKEGAGLKVRTAKDIPARMRELQELLIVADIDPLFISAGQTSEPQTELWTRIGQTVAQEYQKYDGFVLTHDIDSVHYTAPALACAFDGIGKPFVITASPYDLLQRNVPNHIRSMFDEYSGFGNKDNLLNALHVAVADLGETCLVFGNQIHRALEVGLSREPNINYFSSVSGRLVGKVDFGLKLFPPVQRRHARTVRFQTKYNSDILTLDIHPGVANKQLAASLAIKPKAVFIKLDELSTMPTEVAAALSKLARANVPVLVFRESGGGDQRGPFIRLNSLPYHIAYVLAVWALGQANTVPKLKSLIEEKLKRLRRKGAG